MNAQEWILEISAAKKREKDFRVEGQKILDIYCGKEKVPFNILYSNTETLMPSLYSAIPRPVVDRRFKDDDELARSASEAGRRVLEFLVDTNIEGYETYDEGVRAAVLDALLPGRGVTSIKYDAEIVGEEPEEATGDVTEDEDEADEAPVPYKSGELVCVEARKWNRFLHGYAGKWSKVPWIAFGEDIDRGEAARLFGDKVAKELSYTDDAGEDKDQRRKRQNDEDKGARKTTPIWVIWSKTDRKVLFLSEYYSDGFLKPPVDDPLGITGFFPIPKPISFVEKANDLSITALYKLYAIQAEELNQLSKRIIRIVHAIKARGIYDTELGSDIQRLMEGEDNDLVPADKASSLAAEKGLGNAIWFMPLDMLVATLQQLLTAREACKAVIWEIMGIADIMRGSSAASETLGAQQIKQAWGSLRLKRMQKEVMRYCRDLLRIMLEVAANKFSEDTWAKMTGLPYLTEQQASSVQMQLQAMQSVMGQIPQQTQGQPLPPEIQSMQQKMQQLQQEASKPRWADVIAILKDDVQRAYRIDIETNSTVEPEAAEDQKNIAELMNAIGQFLAGVNPLIEKGVMPFEAAQAMLLAIVRRYRFGTEIEDQIKAMKPPQPQDDGTQAKLAMEKEKHQAEMRAKQVDQQAKQQELQTKAKVDQQRVQMEMAKMQMEMQFAEREHAFKMAELSAKTQMAEVVNASKIKVAMATAAMKEKAASQPPETAQ